jgi:hypothetical protein
VSAVLCVGVCVLWVQSYRGPDVLTLADAADGDRRTIASGDDCRYFCDLTRGLGCSREGMSL